jgi:hypothetical protein
VSTNALVLISSTNAGEYFWTGDRAWPQFNEPAGTYAGGQGYSEGTSTSPLHLTWAGESLCNMSCNNSTLVDFSFETFVASGVPESSTWAMMILGFLGLGFLTYRKKATLRFV